MFFAKNEILDKNILNNALFSVILKVMKKYYC